ncbi:Transcription factor bHLH [Heracleum sosnowskyi]|uniref:Transcription factor bHLH n=1 Tax=Heracleum sosnowskyi TaxID=360622 RepID=A0AAD8N465_9APIA|nr:Transcription factor bHLH [Heracleum sosnowskyi]
MRYLSILWVALIILASHNNIIIGGDAMRPLSEYKVWLREFQGPLLLESLQRGPVPPSSSSPCTNIPGGSGRCTLEVNFAAGATVHPPPLPPPPFHKESAN